MKIQLECWLADGGRSSISVENSVRPAHGSHHGGKADGAGEKNQSVADLFGFRARLKGSSRVAMNSPFGMDGGGCCELDELSRFLIDRSFSFESLPEGLQRADDVMVSFLQLAIFFGWNFLHRNILALHAGRHFAGRKPFKVRAVDTDFVVPLAALGEAAPAYPQQVDNREAHRNLLCQAPG